MIISLCRLNYGVCLSLIDGNGSICLQWIEEPTLLVTRFEYANLFHTITDWYSAYVASRVTDLPYRPHLIFVDGHSRVCYALCFTFMISWLFKIIAYERL